VNHSPTREDAETLALALEEAAVRVRQSVPAGFEFEVKDHQDSIYVGPPTQYVPGMRSPVLRSFRIEWRQP
jgi:hypothetical protein